MNVTVDLQRLCWFVENGFETSLKQWSDSTVFSIEPHTVADIKTMGRFAKVAPGKSTRVARAMRTTNAVSREEHNIYMFDETKESRFLGGHLCFV